MQWLPLQGDRPPLLGKQQLLCQPLPAVDVGKFCGGKIK
jgi:hypothetical protein